MIFFFNECHMHMLTHIRHYSRWVLDPGRHDYITHTDTHNFIIQFTKHSTHLSSHTFLSDSENPKLILWLSSWRDGEGSGAPPHPVRGSTWHRVSFHRHSGQKKALPDTVRQPKKERQTWNNTGSRKGHIQLNRSTSCTIHPTAHLP